MSNKFGKLILLYYNARHVALRISAKFLI